MNALNLVRTAAAVPGAVSAAGKAVDPALKKAAEAFEAVFLRQIIGAMRQSSLGDDLFGSQATEQFRDLADARTADDMAARGAIGIADMLLKQFEGLAAMQATTGTAAVKAAAAATDAVEAAK